MVGGRHVTPEHDAGDCYPRPPAVKPKLLQLMAQWVARAPAADASAGAGVEDGSSDVTVCMCVCACIRTSLLIERLLHYYNRQEPPMKGSSAFQTNHNVSNVVYNATVLVRAAACIAFVRHSENLHSPQVS